MPSHRFPSRLAAALGAAGVLLLLSSCFGQSKQAACGIVETSIAELSDTVAGAFAPDAPGDGHATELPASAAAALSAAGDRITHGGVRQAFLAFAEAYAGPDGLLDRLLASQLGRETPSYEAGETIDDFEHRMARANAENQRLSDAVAERTEHVTARSDELTELCGFASGRGPGLSGSGPATSRALLRAG